MRSFSKINFIFFSRRIDCVYAQQWMLLMMERGLRYSGWRYIFLRVNVVTLFKDLLRLFTAFSQTLVAKNFHFLTFVCIKAITFFKYILQFFYFFL